MFPDLFYLSTINNVSENIKTSDILKNHKKRDILTHKRKERDKMIEFMRTADLALYDIFILVGAVLVIILNFSRFREMKLVTCNAAKPLVEYVKSKKEKFPIETIIVVLEILILTIVQYIISGEYNIWVGKMLGTGANYFGLALIGPLIIAVLCFILRTDLLRTVDLIAPSYSLGLIFSKFGCFCAGCCNGIEWEHGLYNYETGLYEVPVQLIEMGFALSIFVFLSIIRKKAKTGTLFPIYLILYSSTRFCSEFLRSEPDVFLNLKLYHILCLAGVVFGVIFYIIAVVFGEKISRLYTMEFSFGKYFQDASDEIDYNYHQIKKGTTKKENQVVHHKKKRRK